RTGAARPPSGGRVALPQGGGAGLAQGAGRRCQQGGATRRRRRLEGRPDFGRVPQGDLPPPRPTDDGCRGMTLLDTDVFSLLLAGHPRVAERHRRAEDEVAITVVTRIEAYQGRFAALL